MKTATVTAKIDSGVKSRVQKIASKNGVTLSFLISQALRKIDRDSAIPFDEFAPNAATVRAIRQDARDVARGDTGPVFKNAKDAVAYLDNL